MLISALIALLLLPLFFVGNMQCAFINLYIFFRNSNFLLHFCSYFYAFSREVSSLSSISASLIYLLIVLVIPMSHALFFLLSLMFLRKNRFFCFISHWISFTQKRSILALIPIGFPSAKMSISGLVLIGCRERSLEPHQCSSPICTILPLFIHILHTLLFFKQKTKP